MERGSERQPPQSPGVAPRGSWVTLVLFFGAAVAAAVLLNFLTLGFITPFFVLGAAIFALIGLQYLVWGWWFERIYRAPYLAQAGTVRPRDLASGSQSADDRRWDLSRVFPYVVPQAALQMPAAPGGELSVTLGHGLAVVLVHEQAGACRGVQAEELASLRLTAAELHRRALENLAVLVEHPQITKRLHREADGLPYWVWSGHWLVASCLRLPELYRQAVAELGAERLLVSIPQRERMFIFPEGDRAWRERMRALIQQRQHAELSEDGPLTWEFFSLTPAGVTAFCET